MLILALIGAIACLVGIYYFLAAFIKKSDQKIYRPRMDEQSNQRQVCSYGEYKDESNLINAAANGDAIAQSFIRSIYFCGEDGVGQDRQQAFEWYSKAASQGLATAQYNLGSMYLNGEGVRQDYRKAFEWYSKAAAQGLEEAQYNIGVMYT